MSEEEEAKERKREQNRQWRKANPEKAAESSRRWAKKNRDKMTAAARRYREAHPDKILERERQSYRENPERRKESSRRWRDRNPEKRVEAERRYRKENPDKVSAKHRRQRARVSGALGSHTEAEWQALCDFYGNKCLACGSVPDKLTRDHVIPLAKGGSDDISNIQPLCNSCNSRKGARNTIDYRLSDSGTMPEKGETYFYQERPVVVMQVGADGTYLIRSWNVNPKLDTWVEREELRG